MKNTFIITACLICVITSARSQYQFNFEVRDTLNELSDQPVFITQIDAVTDNQKFCLSQNKIQNQERSYAVTRPILAISYMINGRCNTQYLREREFRISPQKS
jgi:hypothetical protein